MVKEFCCENKRKVYELIESTNSRLMGASTNETKKRWQVVRVLIPFLSVYDNAKMNKAVRDYKEEKGVARDYLRLIKDELNACNCVEEKEGRFDKLESNLEVLWEQVEKARKEINRWKDDRIERNASYQEIEVNSASALPKWTVDHIPGRRFWNKNASEQKLGNLIGKDGVLDPSKGGYQRVRKEEVIGKIEDNPNEWSFKRLQTTHKDREKKSNFLIHDSCEFRDGKLVREYGKFHYKKSFTKKELKDFKEAKKSNYHNRLMTQVEVSPKGKDY